MKKYRHIHMDFIPLTLISLMLLISLIIALIDIFVMERPAALSILFIIEIMSARNIN